MKRFILTLALAAVLSNSSYAQKDTVSVQGYFDSGGTYGTLNDAIQAAKNAGTINHTVFRLKPYEFYVLSSSIFIDRGESLDIWAPKPGTAQESAPPQIVWTEEEVDRNYIVQSYGDVRMQNVWIRYADILGNKVSSSLVFENQAVGQDPEVGFFDGVLFDYAGIGAEAGGSITVKSDHFDGTFLNCYFRNNSDNHFRYYGRAVSFPYQSTGWHYDHLLFENTTFTNIGRIVMMEGNEFGEAVHLNHVTILNTLEHVLQSGWNKRLSITNSIIINPFMMGYRAVDVCDPTQDYDDFQQGLCAPPDGGMFNGIPVDSFGFAVDFTDADREIFVGYNDYFYYPWFLDWMQNCTNICEDRKNQGEHDLLSHPYPPFGKKTVAFMDSVDAGGQKVFPSMTIDSTRMYDIDPGFILPATNQPALLKFVENKWDDNADIDWSFMPESGFNQTWPLPEDMSYTDVQLQEAAMGGFPLGDLNWWPAELADWQTQRDAEWNQISDWLQNGIVTLEASVFLQGAMSGDSMSTMLNSTAAIPTSQPFAGPPWNYPGTESVASIPPEVVDWVLIEIRTDESAATAVYTAAAFLRSDGAVTALDGSGKLILPSLSAGDYFVVLRHRNHLDAMTAAKITFSTSGTTADLTSGVSAAFGLNGMALLTGGSSGLHGCDINKDGQITAGDFNLWLADTKAGASGYLSTDCNLDGQVTAADFNLWLANTKTGASSQVPD